jgi:hypothetical protein
MSEDVAEDVTKNKSKKGDTKEDLGGKFLDMYSSIYTMRQDLDRIRKPVGTREHPVRTCKDLFYGHPQFKDGEQISCSESKDLPKIKKLSMFILTTNTQKGLTL